MQNAFTKKIIFICLVCAIVATVLFGFIFVKSDSNIVVDNQMQTTQENTQISYADPVGYGIGTEGDIRKFLNNEAIGGVVRSQVYLTNDVVVSFTNSDYTLAAGKTFDGNGFKITLTGTSGTMAINSSGYLGMFVDSNLGTIKNVVFETSSSFLGSFKARDGWIAIGVIAGFSSGLIDNCIVNINHQIYCSGNYNFTAAIPGRCSIYMGGIVGFDENSTISNCTVNLSAEMRTYGDYGMQTNWSGEVKSLVGGIVAGTHGTTYITNNTLNWLSGGRLCADGHDGSGNSYARTLAAGAVAWAESGVAHINGFVTSGTPNIALGNYGDSASSEVAARGEVTYNNIFLNNVVYSAPTGHYRYDLADLKLSFSNDKLQITKACAANKIIYFVGDIKVFAQQKDNYAVAGDRSVTITKPGNAVVNGTNIVVALGDVVSADNIVINKSSTYGTAYIPMTNGFKNVSNTNVFNATTAPGTYIINYNADANGVVYDNGTNKVVFQASPVTITINKKTVNVSYSGDNIFNAKISISGLIGQDKIATKGNGDNQRIVTAGTYDLNSVNNFNYNVVGAGSGAWLVKNLQFSIAEGILLGDLPASQARNITLTDGNLTQIIVKQTSAYFGHINSSIKVNGVPFANCEVTGNTIRATITDLANLVSITSDTNLSVRNFAVSINGTANDMPYGSVINTTAAPVAGKSFCGWKNNGVFISYNPNLFTRVNGDMTLVAVYENTPTVKKVIVKGLNSNMQEQVFYVPSTTSVNSIKTSLTEEKYMGAKLLNLTISDWDVTMIEDGYLFSPVVVFENTVKLTINGVESDYGYGQEIRLTLNGGNNAWKVNGEVVSKQNEFKMYAYNTMVIEQVNTTVPLKSNNSSNFNVVSNADGVFFVFTAYVANASEVLNGATITVSMLNKSDINNIGAMKCVVQKPIINGNYVQFVLSANDQVFINMINKANFSATVNITKDLSTILTANWNV